MGMYLNPTTMSKEDWLRKHASRCTVDAARSLICDGTLVPVCLVDNGVFTAAAIVYDEREFECFSMGDERPKYWYACSREALIDEDSSLQHVLQV